MSVGGGGKIGGGFPPQPLEGGPQKLGQKSVSSTQTSQSGPKASDAFEMSGGRIRDPMVKDMSREPSQSADVLRLARDNPAGAKQLAATMRARSQELLGRIQQEQAGARAALEQLGAKKFSKDELKKRAEELRQKREKLMRLKTRHTMGERKLALLQRLAGRLGDPRLNEELDRLLGHHDKLNTDWGKRHYLLGIGEYFFGDEEDTPEHLREVVRTSMRGVTHAEATSVALQKVSPRRVISELIARTIDGSTPASLDGAGADNEGPRHPITEEAYGSAFQTWSSLRETIQGALRRDPLAKREDGEGEGT